MRILATAEVPSVAREAFAPLGPIEVDPGGFDAGVLLAEILIVRGATVDARLLARARCLRVIARTGAGYDNIDVTAATRLGVPIVYAPEVGSQPVAEGALALMLAAAKRLRELGTVVHGSSWASRYGAPGLDIEGACVGIVGLGSIGRRVARLCAALGMRVIAYDPQVRSAPPACAELVPLAALIAHADVITLHCALTDRTRGMIDAQLLGHVKPGAILVNVARGEIVESEDALADALHSGRLGAVALDVFPSEPPDPTHRLYRDERVICTPHTVGLTERWNREVFRSLADGVARVLHGEAPANLLNPEAMIEIRRSARRRSSA
jgi:D-3-phosphoglycerate dehydrogenase / 2-oxoglutarate reductase